MTDFMLTKGGDLMFVNDTRKNNAIKIKFLFSNSNAIRAQFFLEGCQNIQPGPSQIKISFELTDKKTTQTAKLIHKKEFAKQACSIRLRTSLGELKERKEIGSLLETIRHDFLFSSKTIASAQVIAQDALKDLFPYAKITAEPVAKQTPTGYVQVMLIKVYDEDTIILEHELR